MNLRVAWQSLLESWQRAVLSAIGIMVASIAILLLVSIGLGVQKDITSQVEDIGANVLVVVPGRIEFGNFNPNLGGKSYLSDQNAVDAKRVPGVVRVAKWSFAGGGISAGGKDAYPLLVAATPEWFSMHKMAIQEGRLYGSSEAEARVCVLGSVAKKTLFGEEPAVGKTVQINGVDYRVSGVTEDKGSEQSLFSMQSLSNVAYIPLEAVRQTTTNVQIDRLLIQVAPDVEPKSIVKGVENALGQTLDRQQFSVLTQEDLLGLIFKVMGILTTLVVGLTSIALFVGGVGIMAVMLMAVNERSKEIGIRKTTGATRRDIFWQFLFEAAFIGLAGVLAGLVLSLGVCWALATWTKIKPLVTAGTIGLAFGTGIGVGCIFGLIPAMKAARKDPVDALRNE